MVNPRRPEILRNNRVTFKRRRAQYACSLFNISGNSIGFAKEIKMYTEAIQELEEQIKEINEELGDE